jgi:demethylphylloquinol methyltransferase
MTEVENQVQNLFNRIAPNYDRLNDWLSLGQHRIWKKMAIRWCAPQPGQCFLDLCCGSGDLALGLAPLLAPGGEVIGVDFAAETLAIAAQRSQSLPQSAQKTIRWQVGDAMNLDFDAASFDGATMSYGLRNVQNIPGCLQELVRVLKPGAIATILDFHRPSDPVMQAFQRWYLENVVVNLASQQGVRDEYAYIQSSLERFPRGLEQEQLAISAGFTKARHYPLAGGMMGILVLQKS